MPKVLQVSARGIYDAQASVNRLICLDHYLLGLTVWGFPASEPGQFVNVLCRPVEPVPGARGVDWPAGRAFRLTGGELQGRQPLLRRPLSLAGRRDLGGGRAELELIFHVIGVGTAAMAEMPVGARVNLMGPLGRGFRLVDKPTAVLIGGGAGIPPLLYLAEVLQSRGREAVAFAGARTGRLLPLTIDPAEPPSQAGWPTRCTAEFAARGADTAIATDDGSLGAPGMVHEVFLRWLDRRPQGAAGLAVYACGPEPMLQAVATACIERDIPCQVSMERHMACGVGTCQGCVHKFKADPPAGWRYRLVCSDGPVFDARDVFW